MGRRSHREKAICAMILLIGIIMAVVGQLGLLWIAMIRGDFITRVLYFLQISGLGFIGIWRGIVR